MLSDISNNSDRESGSGEPNKVKKRKKTGRVADAMKKLRATSHEIGDDCKCTHLKCFEIISPEERRRIIKQFNEMGDFNVQTKHLSGLITLVPI